MKQIFFKTKKQRGYTLVELALAMTIVGVLTGGILKSQEMIINANIKKTVRQVTEYSAAMSLFYNKYSYLPGDMPNAEQRIPNCTAAISCLNATGPTAGNGIVGIPAQTGSGGPPTYLGLDQSGITEEPTQAWKHMVFAELISGVSGGAEVAWGESHPYSPWAGGFQLQYLTWPAPGNNEWRQGHWIRLQGPVSGGPLMTNGKNPLEPRIAWQIDLLMDDGIANTGYVQSEDGQNGNHGCDWEYTVAGGHNCGMVFKTQQ